MRKYINQQYIKQANALDILYLIREQPQITRKKIEAATHLSWGAVSNITTRLLQEEYIIEKQCVEGSGAGRIPSYFEINPNDHFAIGLDINRSGFSGVVVNLKNEIVASHRYAADWSNRETLIREITHFAKRTIDLANGKKIMTIGIAMQGTVDSAAGISLSVPHCPDWHNVALAAHLQNVFQIPTRLEHDPNCILYAWAQDKNVDDVILLRANQGIGMAVMLDGEILGRPGMFEIGHIPIVKDGIRCSCGRRGCLEAYTSTSSMAARYNTSFETLVRQAAAQDETALGAFREAAHLLAGAFVHAAQLLNISSIVACGSMWQCNEELRNFFCQEVSAAAPDNPPQIFYMEKEDAAFGAALIAIESVFA